MNPISLLSDTLGDEKTLKYLMKMFPKFAKHIQSATARGFSADSIMKSLSKKGSKMKQSDWESLPEADKQNYLAKRRHTLDKLLDPRTMAAVGVGAALLGPRGATTVMEKGPQSLMSPLLQQFKKFQTQGGKGGFKEFVQGMMPKATEQIPRGLAANFLKERNLLGKMMTLRRAGKSDEEVVNFLKKNLRIADQELLRTLGPGEGSLDEKIMQLAQVIPGGAEVKETESTLEVQDEAPEAAETPQQQIEQPPEEVPETQLPAPEQQLPAPEQQLPAPEQQLPVEEIKDKTKSKEKKTIPETGESYSFDFVRNTEGSKYYGGRFGQDVEPSGRYMREGKAEHIENMPNMEAGKLTFENPLVIDWGEGYEQEGNWKKVLSKKYGGKTGKNLSQAIRNDGYDGIITIEEDKRGHKYTSEIVDLTFLDQKKTNEKIKTSPQDTELSESLEIIGRAQAPKKGRELKAEEIRAIPSSNVRQLVYYPKENTVQALFGNGGVYNYHDVSDEEFEKVVEGQDTTVTRGESAYRAFFKGKNPSVGAALDEFFKKGNKPVSQPLKVTDPAIRKTRDADKLFRASQVFEPFMEITERAKALQLVPEFEEKFGDILSDLSTADKQALIFAARKEARDKGKRKTKKYMQQLLNDFKVKL